MNLINKKENKKNLICLFILLSLIAILLSGCDKEIKYGEIDNISPPVSHEVTKSYFTSKKGEILNRAVIFQRAGELEKSIDLLEKFTTHYPNNPVGQFYLGKAYYKNKMYEDSIKRLKKAYMLDKSSLEALLYLGRAYQETGNRDIAVKFLYKYILRESNTYLIQKTTREINSLAKSVNGNDLIGNVTVTDQIIKEKKIALTPKILFNSNTPEIYAVIEIIEAPYNTEIESKWFQIGQNKNKKLIKTYSKKAEGSKNIVFSIKKPSNKWINGEYKLDIIVNEYEKTSIKFYIF